MPEEAELVLAGSSFDADTLTQTIYGHLFTYGNLTTSGSVVLTPTGSLPSPSDCLNGQLINIQSGPTGSLYFFNGIAWKQVMLAP